MNEEDFLNQEVDVEKNELVTNIMSVKIVPTKFMNDDGTERKQIEMELGTGHRLYFGWSPDWDKEIPRNSKLGKWLKACEGVFGRSVALGKLAGETQYRWIEADFSSRRPLVDGMGNRQRDEQGNDIWEDYMIQVWTPIGVAGDKKEESSEATPSTPSKEQGLKRDEAVAVEDETYTSRKPETHSSPAKKVSKTLTEVDSKAQVKPMLLEILKDYKLGGIDYDDLINKAKESNISPSKAITAISELETLKVLTVNNETNKVILKN